MLKRSRTFRTAALLLVVAAVLGGCLLQSDADRIRQLADGFLIDIRDGNAAEAWEALAPATRREAFGDDPATFADALGSGSPDLPAWNVEVPTELDLVWSVPVELDGGAAALPSFLLANDVIGEWSEGSADGSVRVRGINLLAEPIDGRFFIQAGGLAGTD
ncbi:MAG TPA: hypothetical protein VFM19_07675 [Candidatus Limnocylindria bacterium]|nr:hypothetical protein [Candidatus Limnocylindria bacterium]